MSQKTYLVQLFDLEKRLNDYISRWGVKLQANTDDQTWTCIQAVATAIVECLPLVAPPTPED
jgi:hypothetical protein